ncbi:tyrosine-type recombinase/integrase [Arthrobacter cryoconiti]|uniref:Tyrosine-type recombinase/integrase n=1 Tax=Arthrobacter cryoconiti TaxID=748907 RepID=A0ABV8QWL9_9MICC|nr:tyrosine-type recombinase/integrase [Arthrobacter cryoconiti]MCC9068854.1 site-specific integrase [Arthrobacter cryoconiti]
MARTEDRWTKKDKTRTADYGKGKRWRVVWLEDGKEVKKSFATKDAADAHKTWVNHNQLSGTYVSAARGRVQIKELLPDWEAAQAHVKESTKAAIESDLRATITPYWGEKVLADIERSDVQEWVASMTKGGKAARTVDTIFGRLNNFFGWCVGEKRITHNPATGVNLPTGKVRAHQFLTVAQVEALAKAIDQRYSGMAWVLATTGLRISEVTELRVKDFDKRRRRLTISRAVVFVKGNQVLGPPKNGLTRTVPVTSAASKFLSAQVIGKDPDDLIFTTFRGVQVRANNFKRRQFDDAVAKVRADAVLKRVAGEKSPVTVPSGLWVHDLRHTAASWAVQSGASVKSVQRMLGHATASITLDTYAGLFDQDLDDVAERMGEILGESWKPDSP